MAILIDGKPLFDEKYDILQAQAQERMGFAHLKKLKELAIGSGDTVFKADKNGIWLGAAVFANASFRVTPAGILFATGVNIAGTITATAGTIGGWTIGATSLSAVAGGNTTILSSGATAFSAGPTGSPTTTITQAGVLAAVGAIISGALTMGVGSTLSADYINAGTLTGRVVRTSSGVTRVEMKVDDNTLSVYLSGNRRVVIGAGVIAFLTAAEVGSGEIYGLGTNQLGFNVSGSGDFYMNASEFAPQVANTYSLGTSTFKFKDLHLSGDVEANKLHAADEVVAKWAHLGAGGGGIYLWGHAYCEHFLKLKNWTNAAATGETSANGDMYYRTDDDVIRVKLAGTWRTIQTA